MSHHSNFLTLWLLSLGRNEEVCKRRRKTFRISSLSSLYISLSLPRQYTATSHWQENIKFTLDFSIISNDLSPYSLIFLYMWYFPQIPAVKKLIVFPTFSSVISPFPFLLLLGRAYCFSPVNGYPICAKKIFGKLIYHGKINEAAVYSLGNNRLLLQYTENGGTYVQY